jgi:hypothetical protein
VKSTNSTIAIDPNDAKIPITGFPITSEANANTAGITTAARAARRVADNPASLARNHPRTEPTPATPRAYARRRPSSATLIRRTYQFATDSHTLFSGCF